MVQAVLDPVRISTDKQRGEIFRCFAEEAGRPRGTWLILVVGFRVWTVSSVVV
jgi:hypothetical protein